jgi:amino acid adenylation domain-containing protein
MLEDAAAQVLLTEKSLVERLPERGARLVILDAEWESVSRESAEPFDSGVTPENLAYVIYTSGSTGQPKGVAMPHRALVSLLYWQSRNSRLAGNARTLQFAPLSFDVSFQEIFSTWATGGELLLVRDDLRRDSESLWRYIRERRIARLFLPFVALQDLAEASAAIADLPEDLIEVITAGEQLHVTRQVAELFGRLSGSRLHNQYGPTESHVVTSHSLSGAASEWVPLPPIGRPIDNSRVYALDRDLNLAPIGVTGEIHIGGVNVARGYLNRPELTAERFIPDPLSGRAGERLYRTGDLARYLPNGEIEFLGRDDHQVKIRGFRVELGEVEAALMEHRVVKNAVVLARDGASGQRRLAAYIVAATGARPSADELLKFLREKLPEYMAPAAFIFLDALPMTPSGKVDRRALHAPEAARPDPAESFIAARTPVEEMLAEIWRQALDVEHVGARDNFFELGGHSLLATQLISRVRAAFNIELPLRALFDSPTVEGLASRVEQELRSGRCAPPPITALARDGAPPLSFAQRRLWFLDQLEPGGAIYNLPLAIRFKGRLDIAALENSLGEVARRHDVLRTTFDSLNGEPVTVIADAATLKLPTTDLTTIPPEEREAEAIRLAKEEARRPFDLTRGPLARARALRLSDEDHIVLFTMHHIISDGWSLGVLAHEMTALYRAFARDEPSRLAELPIQYADYAEWQRGVLKEEFLASQLEYWKKRLAGAPPASGILADRPRLGRPGANGAVASIDFSPEFSAAVKAFASEENATLFMTLLAAFLALLARYTGQTDLCVGAPIAGRGRGETESLIGFFVNTLALRVDLSGEPTFNEMLRRVRDVCLGAYAHQDLPFERLVEELQPERDMSRTPLFQVMFALQNTPQRKLELPGVELSMTEIETGAAKFELTLVVADRREGLRVTAEYNSDLYEAETIRCLLSRYELLLDAAVADPELRLANLPLLDETERRRLLVEWNQTQRDYPLDQPLHAWFAAQAAETPNRIAVESGFGRITYAELNSRADRLALRLRRLCVGPEVVVAVLCDHSVELPLAVLATLKAGGAYLPLDPSSPPQRLAFILKDSGASVVLTRERMRDRLPQVEAEVICLDEIGAVADEGSVDPTPSAAPVSVENLAYVIYTSGSTGEPKGVMVTHRGLSNYLRWGVEAYRMGEGTGAPLHSSVAFDMSVTSLFGPLLSGGRVVMRSGEGGGIEWLAETLRGGRRYSLVKLTPSHARLLGEQMRGERVSVGALVVGGEALRGCDVEAWSGMAPEAELVNEYGPTEAVVGCCVYRRRVGELRVGAEEGIPIGRPIANARLYVLDGEMEPTPVGVAGELYIGGVGVARGYLNRPGMTAERFVPDRFSGEDGARMYRTGDMARHRWDGELEYLGRVDEQVKVRGYRVEPGEIEAALRAHPATREAVVTAQRDDLGQQRLIAFLVFNETASAPPTANQLREHLADRLPEHMIPSAFVQLSEPPLTANGKLDRRALQARASSEPRLKVEHIAPRTPTEERLAQIFADVLGVGRVGVHDGFFALGGHSLLATRAISLARAAFQLEIPLRSLFEHPTVAGLASIIERMRLERIGEAGMAEIMERLEHLSEAEAEAMLAEHKNAIDGGAAYA